MPNERHGDHPLTDILVHKLEVCGAEAGELIRRIAGLCSRRELEEWWDLEIDGSQDKALALARARERYGELLSRAREGRWGMA